MGRGIGLIGQAPKFERLYTTRHTGRRLAVYPQDAHHSPIIVPDPVGQGHAGPRVGFEQLTAHRTDAGRTWGSLTFFSPRHRQSRRTGGNPPGNRRVFPVLRQQTGNDFVIHARRSNSNSNS